MEIPFAVDQDFDLGDVVVGGFVAGGLAVGFDADVEGGMGGLVGQVRVDGDAGGIAIGNGVAGTGGANRRTRRGEIGMRAGGGQFAGHGVVDQIEVEFVFGGGKR